MAEGSHYDKAQADYVVAFIECLCHTKGRWAGKPFYLMPWQEQIVRDIFGTLKSDGHRQFTTAYIEIPKKNGKSELAAAIALYLLFGDGEASPEVYGAAADRAQASIVMDVAATMTKMTPALSKRSKILTANKRIISNTNNGFYQVLSAEVGTKHGLNVSGLVLDEVHAQPNRKLYDVLTKGSGDAREQPLYFLITTAGNDQNSICWELHQKALDILEGRNPCPCGFYPEDRCHCTQAQIQNYQNRIPGPILDRIDLCTDAPRVPVGELLSRKTQEKSEDVRRRVIAAQERQAYRFREEAILFNGEMNAAQTEKYCILGRSEKKFVKEVFRRMDLSARAFHRILRVSRTIADLEGEERILEDHLAEAVGYRSADRRAPE